MVYSSRNRQNGITPWMASTLGVGYGADYAVWAAVAAHDGPDERV
jgi:hypothetical protein